MPALIWAWREGIWPWPACSTWPMTTCSTCSGSTPARSSAALDREPAELGGVERGQAAAHLADRGARGAEDHGLGHGGGSLLSVGEQGRESQNGSGPLADAHGAGPRGGLAAPRADATAHCRRPTSRWRWISCRPCRYRDHPTAARATPTRSRSASSRARSPPRSARRARPSCSPRARRARSFKALALAHAEGRRWLLVGLGARARLHARARARGGGRGRARARASLRRARCAGRLPADGDAGGVAAALVEGTILGDYRFERYKSEPPTATATARRAPKRLER